MGRNFRWEQGEARDQEVRVRIDVPEGTEAKDVDFEVGGNPFFTRWFRKANEFMNDEFNATEL